MNHDAWRHIGHPGQPSFENGWRNTTLGHHDAGGPTVTLPPDTHTHAAAARPEQVGVLYCRRCDLGFCAEHLDQHPDIDGHRLEVEPACLICSVCAGIYKAQ